MYIFKFYGQYDNIHMYNGKYDDLELEQMAEGHGQAKWI